MRVVRIVLGILLLTIGLPLLLAGAGLWTAMQHRDAGGAFSAELEEITTPGYAVVVPDIDALLRRQAPFTRADQTRLRITAQTAGDGAFIGLAPPAEVASFLAGVAHTQIDEVKLARGALPVRTVPVAGDAVPATGPHGQEFWARSGVNGLDWSPSATRNQRLAMVIMRTDGQPASRMVVTAELRPGWLNSSTWGLLMLGSVLILLGILFLGWPTRAREVVYVVDPSQVPDIAARLKASTPSLASLRDLEPYGGKPTLSAESPLAEPTTPELPAGSSVAPSPDVPSSSDVLPSPASLSASVLSASSGTWGSAKSSGPFGPTSPVEPSSGSSLPGTVSGNEPGIASVTSPWPGAGSPPVAPKLAWPPVRTTVPAADAGSTAFDQRPSGGAATTDGGTASANPATQPDVAADAEPTMEPVTAGSVTAGSVTAASVLAGSAEAGDSDGTTSDVPSQPRGASGEGRVKTTAKAAAKHTASNANTAGAAGAAGTAGAIGAAGAPDALGAVGVAETGPVSQDDANAVTVGVPVARPAESLGAEPTKPSLAIAPPQVVPARASRRRRASAAGEAGTSGGDSVEHTAGGGGKLEAPNGAGIGAAVAAGRRPGRPRGTAKAKPAKNEADQPVA